MSKNLLLIEDDPDGEEMLTTVLNHLNFNVESVGDGSEASNMIASMNTAYDVIIIDLALPGKDGWEILSEVLNNPDTAGIPCVAITAYHNSKLRQEALDAGFSAYLSKPIDSQQLSTELNLLVG